MNESVPAERDPLRDQLSAYFKSGTSGEANPQDRYNKIPDEIADEVALEINMVAPFADRFIKIYSKQLAADDPKLAEAYAKLLNSYGEWLKTELLKAIFSLASEENAKGNFDKLIEVAKEWADELLRKESAKEDIRIIGATGIDAAQGASAPASPTSLTEVNDTEEESQ